MYTFANVNTTYKANTLKLNVRVHDWPFYTISNNLAIVLDSNNQESSVCVNDEKDESGSLRWVMVNTDNISLYLYLKLCLFSFLFFLMFIYGQYLPQAMIDNRVRIVNYTLNSDKTITATLPHFWEYAGMNQTNKSFLKIFLKNEKY